MPTALPPTSDFVTTGESKGTFKGALTGLRAFLAGLLGTGGGQGEALTTLGAPMNGSILKSGAYTVVAADRGKVLKCSGTWSLAFTAAATLGDGFVVEIANTGAGVITLDPNLSETIDAVSSIALAAGKSLIAYCDGTQILTFGRGGVESFNSRGGAVTLTSGDVTTALGYTPPSSAVPIDAYSAIGGTRNSPAITGVPGTTYAGSSIGWTGTVRCTGISGIAPTDGYYVYAYQRIA